MPNIQKQKLEDLIKIYIDEITKKYGLSPLSAEEKQNVATTVADDILNVNHHVDPAQLRDNLEMRKLLFLCIADAMINQKNPSLNIQPNYGEIFHEKLDRDQLDDKLKLILKPMLKKAGKEDPDQKTIDDLILKMKKKLAEKMQAEPTKNFNYYFDLDMRQAALCNLLGGKINPSQEASLTVAVFIETGNGNAFPAYKEGNENSASILEKTTSYDTEQGDPSGLEKNVQENLLALGENVMENLIALGDSVDAIASSDNVNLYDNSPKPSFPHNGEG